MRKRYDLLIIAIVCLIIGIGGTIMLIGCDESVEKRLIDQYHLTETMSSAFVYHLNTELPARVTITRGKSEATGWDGGKWIPLTEK